MMVEDFTRRRFLRDTAKMAAAFRAAGFFKSERTTITLNSEYPPSWLPAPAVTNSNPIPMGWYMEKPVSMSIINPKRPLVLHEPDIVKPRFQNDFQTERLCAYIRQRQQDQITYYQILNLYYEAEVHGERIAKSEQPV